MWSFIWVVCLHLTCLQYFTKCTTGPSNPFHGAISFDNIGLAWVAIFLVSILYLSSTGCPNKHGKSVTNSISSLLWIRIVITNFKSHNIIMSAAVYFMKTVNGCKDVSTMSPQDEQWRRTVWHVCTMYTVIFLFF